MLRQWSLGSRFELVPREAALAHLSPFARDQSRLLDGKWSGSLGVSGTRVSDRQQSSLSKTDSWFQASRGRGVKQNTGTQRNRFANEPVPYSKAASHTKKPHILSGKVPSNSKVTVTPSKTEESSENLKSAEVEPEKGGRDFGGQVQRLNKLKKQTTKKPNARANKFFRTTPEPRQDGEISDNEAEINDAYKEDNIEDGISKSKSKSGKKTQYNRKSGQIRKSAGKKQRPKKQKQTIKKNELRKKQQDNERVMETNEVEDYQETDDRVFQQSKDSRARNKQKSAKGEGRKSQSAIVEEEPAIENEMENEQEDEKSERRRRSVIIDQDTPTENGFNREPAQVSIDRAPRFWNSLKAAFSKGFEKVKDAGKAVVEKAKDLSPLRKSSQDDVKDKKAKVTWRATERESNGGSGVGVNVQAGGVSGIGGGVITGREFNIGGGASITDGNQANGAANEKPQAPTRTQTQSKSSPQARSPNVVDTALNVTLLSRPLFRQGLVFTHVRAYVTQANFEDQLELYTSDGAVGFEGLDEFSTQLDLIRTAIKAALCVHLILYCTQCTILESSN